ncbi:MAG: LON peptidase substrate-binding domain-containing protein [Candidatus Competibacterales bacterium]|nr:LON peptidase substrate-binding domain-containing protein [Candidatus Competibacterales bacterium]
MPGPVTVIVMPAVELPLFPLGTVLYPGGVLPLRIFEPRYLDMVGNCLRQGTGFVVVALSEGHEAGSETIAFHALGTRAEIVDFDQLEDGMLGLTCRGAERLRVTRHRVRPDRLILANLAMPEPEPAQAVGADHRPLAEFLRELLDRDEAEPYRRWLQEDWSDAGWLGFRLAELLPLPLELKVHLLELSDPERRLDILATILRDNRLL